jgi:hypothetical protein
MLRRRVQFSGAAEMPPLLFCGVGFVAASLQGASLFAATSKTEIQHRKFVSDIQSLNSKPKMAPVKGAATNATATREHGRCIFVG